MLSPNLQTNCPLLIYAFPIDQDSGSMMEFHVQLKHIKSYWRTALRVCDNTSKNLTNSCHQHKLFTK